MFTSIRKQRNNFENTAKSLANMASLISNKEKCMIEIATALDNIAVCGIMKVPLLRYFYVWFRSMFYAKFKEV